MEDQMKPVQEFTFTYERLDAYQVARELTRRTAHIAAQVPRGYGYLTDHLLRSGSAPARLIAEGALRVHWAYPPIHPNEYHPLYLQAL